MADSVELRELSTEELLIILEASGTRKSSSVMAGFNPNIASSSTS